MPIAAGCTNQKINKVSLSREANYVRACFQAMACPCELLVAFAGDPRVKEPATWQLARELGETVAAEAWRVEQKFSRFLPNNYWAGVQKTTDQWQQIDTETAALLDFADQAWRLSNGMFDITSGVLGSIWSFHSQALPPGQEQIDALLPCIGWEKVGLRTATKNRPAQLYIPGGVRMDLGGIGKEYAADRALMLALEKLSGRCASLLVNFGGDLCCSGTRPDGSNWQVGLESVASDRKSGIKLAIGKGALATSGDSKRYLIYKGKRYSHILHPRTGWPVCGAPASVTLVSHTCVHAGMVATLALLQGKRARSFLRQTGMQHWIIDR